MLLDYDADVAEGLQIAQDENFDAVRFSVAENRGARCVSSNTSQSCRWLGAERRAPGLLVSSPRRQAKRKKVEEANAKLKQGAERTLDRARAREARHSYVLEQRRQARERAEKERRERERKEQAEKKEALKKEERRAKVAMEELLVKAKKEATEEIKAVKNMPAGPTKAARIRKLRAKYHPDKNLPGAEGRFDSAMCRCGLLLHVGSDWRWWRWLGSLIISLWHFPHTTTGLREQFTQLSAFVNMETDKLKAH